MKELDGRNIYENGRNIYTSQKQTGSILSLKIYMNKP